LTAGGRGRRRKRKKKNESGANKSGRVSKMEKKAEVRPERWEIKKSKKGGP